MVILFSFHSNEPKLEATRTRTYLCTLMFSPESVFTLATHTKISPKPVDSQTVPLRDTS